MKKFLTITTLIFCALFASAQSPVNVTATLRDKKAKDSVSYQLGPNLIQYVTDKSGSTYVGYQDPYTPARVYEYKVIDRQDSVRNRANREAATLVKVMAVTRVSGTLRDTAIEWSLPIWGIGEIVEKTLSGYPKVNSSFPVRRANSFVFVNAAESPDQLKARIDSVRAALFDVQATRADSATCTQRYAYKYQVLYGSTADTITLLNPSLFAQKGEIVIQNFGSGTWTVTGGYTVKDASGSTVSTISGNSVVKLKAVTLDGGSTYEWRKYFRKPDDNIQ